MVLGLFRARGQLWPRVPEAVRDPPARGSRGGRAVATARLWCRRGWLHRELGPRTRAAGSCMWRGPVAPAAGKGSEEARARRGPGEPAARGRPGVANCGRGDGRCALRLGPRPSWRRDVPGHQRACSRCSAGRARRRRLPPICPFALSFSTGGSCPRLSSGRWGQSVCGISDVTLSAGWRALSGLPSRLARDPVMSRPGERVLRIW